MTDLTQAGWIWLAKGAGAVAGSAISLAYILPKHRRDAAIRFAVGVTCGMIFGGATGLKLAEQIGLTGELGPAETMLMGAAAASLCAWSAIGLVLRYFHGRALDRMPAEAASRLPDQKGR
ncbi:DUF6107 family protein [Nitratireductor pacificus]|uniref:Transmembrane protein n=1 Tax=Nitratireductor pacificus pht-3B TaxID=391937 RepID=K2MGE7_9HYPH|nr:DUF6107 family protein [Nitratireductor pacificus]EKF19780.1 hypothetical protein NA2_05548 [Nitratireductor pacificus pht-3B]